MHQVTGPFLQLIVKFVGGNMKIYLPLLVLFSFSQASACFIPRKETRVDAKTLVQRSSDIVLAKVKTVNEVEGGKAEYTFEIVETVKGSQAGELTLKGQAPGGEDTDFDGHKDVNFWKASSGRARTNPDCSVSASFEVGKQYLIFPNEPFHIKGFELVASAEDPWLTKVKKIITTPEPKPESHTKKKRRKRS